MHLHKNFAIDLTFIATIYLCSKRDFDSSLYDNKTQSIDKSESHIAQFNRISCTKETRESFSICLQSGGRQ